MERLVFLPSNMYILHALASCFSVNIIMLPFLNLLLSIFTGFIGYWNDIGSCKTLGTETLTIVTLLTLGLYIEIIVPLFLESLILF